MRTMDNPALLAIITGASRGMGSHMARILAGRGYREREVTLASGDLLFFYTDGCVETENEADEMFGNARLETLLVSIATMGPVTPERVLHQVEQAVTAFRGTREPFDDATMMAVRIG